MGKFLGSSAHITFGPFTLHPDSRQLCEDSNGRPVHMTPKAFELLSLLVENRPRALAKSELHRTLWPSTFVSDATLTSLVAELREALGDHGRERQFIRTVHRFGYAFSSEVSEHKPAAQPMTHTWIVFDHREMALARGDYSIGRDPLSAITLLSPTVSKRHARISIGEVATIEDLGSKNGTFVRGEPIAGVTLLEDGDRIRIGSFDLTIRIVTGSGSTDTH
ncbi:MAG TPA: winged helix-turn-helix domain-containing protein [Vicinamibacterales bacterium]